MPPPFPVAVLVGRLHTRKIANATISLAMAIRMYFLHKTFPDLVEPEYSLRAVNYILGAHPWA